MDIATLRSQADAGSLPAQVELGLRYLDGDGVAEDLEQARRWLTLAADRGAPRAQVNLGAIHDNGWGVAADPAKARALYERAVAGNEFMAMILLARLHASGRGVAPSPQQAAALYRRALGFAGRIEADEELAEARAFLAEVDVAAAGAAPVRRSVQRVERPHVVTDTADTGPAAARAHQQQRKPWHAYLPAILAGAAAFLAAASTFYVNVRSDLRRAEPTTQPAAVVTAAPAIASAAAATAANRVVQLQLLRIEVLDDGSYGSTDWRFRVEADGRELFAMPAREFNDKAGANVVVPSADDDARARVELLPGEQMLVKVIGNHGGLRGGEQVQGNATLTAGGLSGPVRVTADKGAAGSFVFHFSAAPASSSE